MTAAVLPADFIRDGERVRVVCDDLAGEFGYVEQSASRGPVVRAGESFASRLLYWVVLDGESDPVPFLRDQLEVLT